MFAKMKSSKRRKQKVKRPPGRPRESWSGYYDHVEFFDSVRDRFTEQEMTVFKTSDERLRMLSKACLERRDLYHGNKVRVIKQVVNAVKDSVIKVEYIQQCLGMDRNQYNQFIRYVKLDAAGENSILLAKKYALANYYRQRYDVLDGKPVTKPGVKDRGLTFRQFEDLVKIAIWDREALLDKFQKSRKGPKRLTPSR